MDDITFCMNGWNDCMVIRCERHPHNIQDKTIPHSYAKLYRTEYCPLEKLQQPKFVKDINVPANDTISRQGAIDAADRADYPGLAVELVKAVTDEVVKELKQLPSAQPDIIRCKDCHWYKTNYMWNGTEVKICAKEAYEPRRNADDFCSNGERK